MPEVNKEDQISKEVVSLKDLEHKLEVSKQALMSDENFKRFIELKKEFNEQSASVWREVEKTMLDNDIKSVKGDWGSVTIAERMNWQIDDIEAIPKKFIKKVVDTKKLSDTYRLENKPIKGATPAYSKYLTKRLK